MDDLTCIQHGFALLSGPASSVDPHRSWWARQCPAQASQSDVPSRCKQAMACTYTCWRELAAGAGAVRGGVAARAAARVPADLRQRPAARAGPGGHERAAARLPGRAGRHHARVPPLGLRACAVCFGLVLAMVPHGTAKMYMLVPFLVKTASELYHCFCGRLHPPAVPLRVRC